MRRLVVEGWVLATLVVCAAGVAVLAVLASGSR